WGSPFRKGLKLRHLGTVKAPDFKNGDPLHPTWSRFSNLLVHGLWPVSRPSHSRATEGLRNPTSCKGRPGRPAVAPSAGSGDPRRSKPIKCAFIPLADN